MSLLALFVSSSLLVAPPPALPDLPVPLGRLSDVLGGPVEGGQQNQELVVEFQPEGCTTKISMNLSRLLGGVSFSLQQLQDWMNSTKGLERSLFVATNRMGAVAERVAKSKSSSEQSCKADKLAEGYQLQLLTAPKLCPGTGKAVGEHWFLGPDRKPAVVVQVSNPPAGSPNKCMPRFSAVFFDDRQATRLRYHADFGGAVTVTLVGDKCQDVDFKLDEQAQVFHAVRRSCKR